jgi:hypothetical protein
MRKLNDSSGQKPTSGWITGGEAMANNSEVYLAWSYERLAEFRADFIKVLNSEFIWQHEDTHVEEIIARIDSTVNLKRQRDGFQASKKGHGSLAS